MGPIPRLSGNCCVLEHTTSSPIALVQHAKELTRYFVCVSEKWLKEIVVGFASDLVKPSPKMTTQKDPWVGQLLPDWCKSAIHQDQGTTNKW